MRPLTLLAATTVALLACGGDDGSNEPNPPSGDITVGNNFFNPSTFNATAGQTVTWAWADGAVTHNIVFVDGAPGSGNLSSGTFQRTFSTAGTYNYFCSIHGASVMSGVVNVAAGSTGDAGGSTGGGSSGGGSSGGGTGGSGMGGGGYGGSPY